MEPASQGYMRKGPDLLVKSLNWFVAAGWILLLGVLILLDQAKPVTENMFHHLLGVDGVFRYEWDEKLVRIIFYCMVFGLLMSTVGIIVNKLRHKRREDEYRWSLFFVLIVSIVGMIIYLL